MAVEFGKLSQLGTSSLRSNADHTIPEEREGGAWRDTSRVKGKPQGVCVCVCVCVKERVCALISCGKLCFESSILEGTHMTENSDRL